VDHGYVTEYNDKVCIYPVRKIDEVTVDYAEVAFCPVMRRGAVTGRLETVSYYTVVASE